MAISVTLYNCADDNRTVHKTLSGGTPYEDCIFKESTELHQPIFTVSETLSADFNYCSISGVDGRTRYYFAEVINLRTNLSVVRCDLDVLMTYGAEIENLTGILKRATIGTRDDTVGNSYLYDGLQPKQVNCEYSSEVIGSFDFINNGCLVVGIIGSTSLWGI